MLHHFTADGRVEAPKRVQNDSIFAAVNSVVLRENDQRAVGPEIVKRGSTTGGVFEEAEAVRRARKGAICIWGRVRRQGRCGVQAATARISLDVI